MAPRRRRATTITDVAKLAGVSIATASKALNGRGQVRPETLQRVLRAAEELSYQPNALAQSLISGRTRTVGLLTGDSVGRFGIPVLLGAEDAFGTGEMAVLLCDARGDSIREQHYIRTLSARRVDGIIVVGESTDPRPSISRDLPVPVVYAYAPSADPDDVSFVPDDVGGARIAVQHLVTAGRRRIAHIAGSPHYRAAQDRAAGTLEALAEAGLELAGGEVLFGAWSQRWGRQAAEIALAAEPGIDAVVCGSDQIAAGFVEAVRERGRRVPDDIAVIGYDNWEVLSAETRPPLTTVDMNLEVLGRTAAQYLFAAIGGRAASGVHRMPCSLVIRDSTVRR
ncbi:LacI family DNA-binding transcriptional regulator [Actinacidiphila bryophytorum]|uniref:LacI family transcriptional regulator n=1 Tax=Actinacidiphila bryophytorum TaxID=1436133 RepID=A0A9W4E7S0_9ACTN|nr:LacI family DNA-binding transcriptional regulator [Actinacidiphila bryophytorum]MBM9434783.1 LacI family DNA-binding transcriptional regulator [Actinacidiphila bryophytorum]MBN6545800.1 LacI family DNA-binding transcriptional regulator [Actinacidiphila bryophytorum]CAG7630119.1 LacI family transcriptional regulator [Actinacidiphila bryophytorum]